MARVKADFGTELKVRRQQHGLTQAQFVEALGSIVARSTIANVEAGRERPSERLWAAIQVRFPELAADLEPVYRTAQWSPAEWCTAPVSVSLREAVTVIG